MLRVYSKRQLTCILHHRLVASIFIDNKNNYKEVNHINGIKDDNRIDNLEWCTRSQNQQHAYDTGLQKGLSGINCSFLMSNRKVKLPSAKLTKEQVEEIKLLSMNGKSALEIQKIYSLKSKTTVYNILRGKSWK